MLVVSPSHNCRIKVNNFLQWILWLKYKLWVGSCQKQNFINNFFSDIGQLIKNGLV
jgi:hypothetical protein